MCYEDDLPSSVAFETELDLWEKKWRGSPDHVIEHIDKDYFPNILVIFHIMGTPLVRGKGHLVC